MESRMECISASIFYTFQWILGGKLGSNMNQKSIHGVPLVLGGVGIVFEKFFWGGARTRTPRPTRGVDFPTPKNIKIKGKHQTQNQVQVHVQVQVQIQVQVQGQGDKITHTRCRAKRAGG